MAEITEGDSNFDALFKAFVMIVVSEIGDKTFLIAAIMATRHPRVTVFGGAFASLVIMSILSAALGKVILGLIPKVWTLWAASLLFLVFGIKMLQESFQMSGGNSHIQEEMREVEEELEEDSAFHDSHNARGTSNSSSSSQIPLENLEEGRISNKHLNDSPSLKNWIIILKENLRNTIQLMTNPVFAQAFVLTFLGEWGDRSQITTIAMGGAHSVPVIAFGTILGHGLCTAGAVIGGRYLSTKISVKHISLIGSAAFIIFAFLYSLEAYCYKPELDGAY
uniref:GDT1 family protein n=1 Tax=Kwoniella pini CBS 10737 TaxID=1296096 RepID=A0A1B9I3K2_9TREE|nr:vacuolar protein [Kwoniella pini CBS 10737]OCF50114.1 vacuolar protein [Kwoniella pini CBS 10737]